ncbi:MAG: hypothetical protein J7L46_07540, partial [Bacteroidales bacterium]|nr:hypothetical protein [Bacteroidales bacterium]
IFTVINGLLAQNNGQNNSNGLWQAKGQDTVSTNREVLIWKNLKVQKTITADSISARRIKVGNHSIVLGGNPQSGTDDIYTDDWDLLIQCESSYNFNTIFNAYGQTGNVGVGTETPLSTVPLTNIYGLEVNNEVMVKKAVKLK